MTRLRFDDCGGSLPNSGGLRRGGGVQGRQASQATGTASGLFMALAPVEAAGPERGGAPWWELAVAGGGEEKGGAAAAAAAGARGARRGQRRVAGGRGGEGGGGGGNEGHSVRRKKGSRAPLARDPSQHNVVLLHVQYELHLIAKPKNKLHVFFTGHMNFT